MTLSFSGMLRAVGPAFFLALVLPVTATVQLVSKPDASMSPTISGGGDSVLPVITPDGRFVLFASTARNLVLTTNSAPIPAMSASLNVYLRDRASNTTALVSMNLAGIGGGNGDSLPMGISTNGRYALFESSANDLATGDTNNAGDVFVRDLLTGTTTLVSVTSNGISGNGASRNPVMTADGRYVAFASAATNLVAGDTNGIMDVFRRDLLAGNTLLVSAGARSTGSAIAPAGSSEAPDITPDGRYVAFYSSATNLVPGVRTAGEVYVRDVLAGSAVLASTNARSLFQSSGGGTNAISCNHRISADASFVVFEVCTNPPTSTCARGMILRHRLATGSTEIIHTNASVPLVSYPDISSLDISPDGRLVAFVGNVGGVSGTNTAVYLWEEQYGTNAAISVDWSNALPATAYCLAPAVSPDGRFVAFLGSWALTTNALPGWHVYLRDVVGGATELIDVGTTGSGAGAGMEAVPQLSADGSLVVFESAEDSLVPGDRNRRSDVFVRNRTANVTELVSVHDGALPSLTPEGHSTIGWSGVSADGSSIAYASDGDDLVANDTNHWRDVFLRDLSQGTNSLISVNTNGFAASGLSQEPAIDGSGRYVAFASSASDLVAGDTNKVQDVFVRDRVAGTTVLVSVNSGATGPGNKESWAPAISADGRYVLFRSQASDLAAGSFSGSENLFLRDRQGASTHALTTAGVALSAMTPDGKFIAFVDSAGAASGNVCLWDTQAAARIATNSTPAGILAIAISPDGNRIASFGGPGTNSVAVLDRAAATNWVAGSGHPGVNPGLRFSLDGGYLAFASSATFIGTSNQVYLHDCQARSTALVSRNTNAPVGGNGVSDSPVISADGRFVAYRSAADDLVAGDHNGVPDVYVHDRLLGSTTLLSGSGSTSANSRSLRPVFSGDGRTLLLQSWASDLVAGDFNQSSDLVAWVFLYASIAPGSAAGEGPTISWPAVPGQMYRVEFKNSLGDTAWQEAAGTVTIVGNRAWLTDTAPDTTNRFYRVVAY